MQSFYFNVAAPDEVVDPSQVHKSPFEILLFALCTDQVQLTNITSTCVAICSTPPLDILPTQYVMNLMQICTGH